MPIFNTLQIVNLGKIIAVINITRATILTIALIIIIIVVSHKKKSVIFVAKKVVTLISIQTINNGKQNNFEEKTENFIEIKANITYF